MSRHFSKVWEGGKLFNYRLQMLRSSAAAVRMKRRGRKRDIPKCIGKKQCKVVFFNFPSPLCINLSCISHIANLPLPVVLARVHQDTCLGILLKLGRM